MRRSIRTLALAALSTGAQKAELASGGYRAAILWQANRLPRSVSETP